MKTLFYAVFLSLFTLTASAQTHDWKKSETQEWKVKKDNKVLSYKIDTDCVVWSSVDEKKWEAVPKNMWTDFEGNVYRVQSKMFFISTDGGQTWDNTPNATWHGGDGMWYKFDDTWGLWVSQR